MFTRKQYEHLAARIRKDRERGIANAATALFLADTFELDNPRFNRAKFLDACGVY